MRLPLFAAAVGAALITVQADAATLGYFVNLESPTHECVPINMTPAQWIDNAYQRAPEATVVSTRRHHADGDDYMVQVKSDAPFVIVMTTTRAACERVRAEITSGKLAPQ